MPYARRPFEGWPGEADLVALREVVPSATAPLTLIEPAHAGRSVTLASVLPMSWSSMVRADGSVVLALQTSQRSGNLAVDLGQALLAALEHETSAGITNLPLPAAGTPSLIDLVAPDPLSVEVHEGFDWWLGEDAEMDEEVAESMASANESVVPTVRLTGVDAAYWCRIGERCHLRWAMTHDEDALLNALARLHTRRELSLGEDSPTWGRSARRASSYPSGTCPPTARQPTSRDRRRRSRRGWPRCWPPRSR